MDDDKKTWDDEWLEVITTQGIFLRAITREFGRCHDVLRATYIIMKGQLMTTSKWINFFPNKFMIIADKE